MVANYNSEFTGAEIDAGITLANSAQQPPAEGAFQDGDKTKLDGIESGADVTDATNVAAAGALMESAVTNVDEVKAFSSSDYATAAQGALADSAQQPPVEGAFVDGDKTKLDGIEAGATADQTAAEIRALVESATDSNVFTDADHAKLDGIEANADVTDTTNVAAAGALMDSEVTNLAAVKAFDPADYATAAQGALADTATQPADIANMVESDPTGVTGADAITNIISLTQAEYDAITPDAATVYVISG